MFRQTFVQQKTFILQTITWKVFQPKQQLTEAPIGDVLLEKVFLEISQNSGLGVLLCILRNF